MTERLRLGATPPSNSSGSLLAFASPRSSENALVHDALHGFSGTAPTQSPRRRARAFEPQVSARASMRVATSGVSRESFHERATRDCAPLS